MSALPFATSPTYPNPALLARPIHSLLGSQIRDDIVPDGVQHGHQSLLLVAAAHAVDQLRQVLQRFKD